MSEKCYYINEGIEFNCSSNSGYGSGFPDECDDCGEFFCSKHLKLHRKDGTCKKIQQLSGLEEEDEIKEELESIPTKLLEEELKRRRNDNQ